MGLHDPFGHLKHKLWPKEESGVKLAVWFPTTKSWELTKFPCMQVMCDMPLETLNEGYNFGLYLISIRGLHTKLWGPKTARVPTLAISGLPFESLETESHLDVGLVERHIVYYKGQGGGIPQVRPVVNLVNPSCSWLILAPKVLQLCINHFVLVLCKSMWVVEACQLFLVPSRSSNTPLYPSKVLRARERAPSS
jgi:hypothetical protein